MANLRIKDVPTSAASTSADDYFAIDGTTNGTRKLSAGSPVFGGRVTVSNGATTSALTDLLINPTTKASGNLIDAQVGGASRLYLTSAGGVAMPYVSETTTPNVGFFNGNGQLVFCDSSGNRIAAIGSYTSSGITARPDAKIGFSAVTNLAGGNFSFDAYLTRNGSGSLGIPMTTASTSTTTGALVVSGGAGFAKDIYINSVRVGLGEAANADSILIGAGGTRISGGTRNLVIGSQSTQGSSLTGNENVIVGFANAQALSSGSNNTVIGSQAGQITTGNHNALIGWSAGILTQTGSNSVAIGSYALTTAANQSGNVAIGFSAGRYETGSNAFYVDNQDRTNTAGDKAKALLYGTFNATAANQTLTINAGTTTLAGNINLTATTPEIVTGTGGLLIRRSDNSSPVTEIKTTALGGTSTLRLNSTQYGAFDIVATVNSGAALKILNGATEVAQFGGAATTLTTLAGNLTLSSTSSILTVSGTTDTTGAGTGALQVSGGAYVAKAIYAASSIQSTLGVFGSSNTGGGGSSNLDGIYGHSNTDNALGGANRSFIFGTENTLNGASTSGKIFLIGRGNSTPSGATVRTSVMAVGIDNSISAANNAYVFGEGITNATTNSVEIGPSNTAKVQITSSGLKTAAPASGTASAWKLGEAATVSPTSPNRTIRVEIEGTVYYIHAKTTND